MNLNQIPGPIPATVQADVQKRLREALALLAPFHLDLTAQDREELGRTGLGPESVPFADTARRLMTAFPDILPRSIKDADIAAYGERLDTVHSCQDLLADLEAVRNTLNNLRVAAGAGLMEMARAAYRAGQDDEGRTAGVEGVVQEMSQRFARKSPKTPPPTV